ncbi:MAG: hypothetical protein CVU89_14675 [Firmicutes bacterium HGW-Firmicutes-14]|nr:MAG: hypothetical protein CVU89_14675 [Firmicutes bacterium HGW-Firmicutes-14]
MFFFGFNVYRGLLGLILLPLAVWAGYWSYRDASAKGISYPSIWAGISFTVFPIGFLMYLSYRLFYRNKV